MAYRALYRQYRPTRFAEVIGQEHITTTLKNQVASDRPAHAYLFCGTRGTGKTSTARILARALNCLSPAEGEPCGVCQACLAAQEEGVTDITEIDAASNNGVSDVRDLIESAQYAPLSLRRRVFIIDEVHMLSGPAFNALLKTLEEPPPHILFILATTEPQKLPATIVSRCQRFDFRRLSLADIKRTLISVLTRAGVSIEDGGLTLIARSAQGSMRDALSLADQCLAFSGDRATTKDVYETLGSMEDTFLFGVTDALLDSDAPRVLKLLDTVIRDGRDLSVFSADLSAHLRALLLAKTCGECADLLECTEDAMKRYLDQAERASEARLMLAVDRLIAAQNDMRFLPAPRAMLESALVHICRPEDALSLVSLEARVDRLEARLAQTPPAKAPCASDIAPEADAGAFADWPVPESVLQASSEIPMDTAPEQASSKRPKTPPAAAKGGEAAIKPAAAQNADIDRGEGPGKSDANDPAALWRAAIARIQNPFVQALARVGVALRLEGDTLTVGFSPAQEAKYKSVSVPINYNPILAALQEVQPDTRLNVILTQPEPAGREAEARARALFGDKLSVE